jgi:hypothetical protein
LIILNNIYLKGIIHYALLIFLIDLYYENSELDYYFSKFTKGIYDGLKNFGEN